MAPIGPLDQSPEINEPPVCLRYHEELDSKQKQTSPPAGE